MKIYIDTKKCVWVLGGRKLIRRITVAADWQKIQRKFEENFELEKELVRQALVKIGKNATECPEFKAKTMESWGAPTTVEHWSEEEIKLDAPV